MGQPITEADLLACSIVEVAHYNGGRVWFGYGYLCVEHPRLYKLVKYIRKTHSTEVIWSVDGINVDGLHDAAARLNVAPVLTEQEREVLERVPHDFTRCRGDLYPFDIMDALANKGQIEFADGKARRLRP